MRAGFISDIHGNFEALKEVLAALDKMGITEIYCLGDVAGYYSQVNECCQELIRRNIPCVMGNHDWYIAGGGFCLRSRSVNDCIVYQRKIITAENLEWIKSFPVQRIIGNMHMLHGGWGDPIDEYLEPTEEYFRNIEGDIFLSGHTHKQLLQQYNGKVYCNPGSVGQPRDNDPRAAFAVYEDGKFSLHRVVYNMDIVFELMDKAGFNDYYYGGLKTGSPTLKRL